MSIKIENTAITSQIISYRKNFGNFETEVVFSFPQEITSENVVSAELSFYSTIQELNSGEAFIESIDITKFFDYYNKYNNWVHYGLIDTYFSDTKVPTYLGCMFVKKQSVDSYRIATNLNGNQVTFLFPTEKISFIYSLSEGRGGLQSQQVWCDLIKSSVQLNIQYVA